MTTKHILLICLGLEIFAISMGLAYQSWDIWLQFSANPIGILIGLGFVLLVRRKLK